MDEGTHTPRVNGELLRAIKQIADEEAERRLEDIRRELAVPPEKLRLRNAQRVYAQCRAHAKRLGYDLDFGRRDVLELLDQGCYSCGHLGFLGLDRLDSRKGYAIDNVAPCCTECNTTFSDMPLEAKRMLFPVMRQLRAVEFYGWRSGITRRLPDNKWLAQARQRVLGAEADDVKEGVMPRIEVPEAIGRLFEPPPPPPEPEPPPEPMLPPAPWHDEAFEIGPRASARGRRVVEFRPPRGR